MCLTLQVLGTPSQEDLAYVRLLSAAAAQFIETQPIVPSTNLDILFPDAPPGVSSLFVGMCSRHTHVLHSEMWSATAIGLSFWEPSIYTCCCIVSLLCL